MEKIDKMFDFLNHIDDYEERKVGKTEIGKLTISTVYTSDEGYETAILDDNGAYPVERYETKKEAERGHKRWVKKAPKLTKITMLGWLDGLTKKEEIILTN